MSITDIDSNNMNNTEDDIVSILDSLVCPCDYLPNVKYFKLMLLNKLDNLTIKLVNEKIEKLQLKFWDTFDHFHIKISLKQLSIFDFNIPQNSNLILSFTKNYFYLDFKNRGQKIYIGKIYNHYRIMISIDDEQLSKNDIFKHICNFLENYYFKSISFGYLESFNCDYFHDITKLNSETLDLTLFVFIDDDENLIFNNIKN